MKLKVLTLVVLTAPILAAAASTDDADAILARIKGSSSREERKEFVEQLLTKDRKALEKTSQWLETQIGELRTKYIRSLDSSLRTAYFEKLNALSDEQILKIQQVRRLWKNYVLETYRDSTFHKSHLLPAAEVSKLLLLNVESLMGAEVTGLRGQLLEYGEYQTRCNQALGVHPDPTNGKKSPSGVAIPHLNSPPTFNSNLSYLEKSLVLANTVGPEGARKVLMKNVELAQEIDIEEADYVLYANEIRMVMGSIAWVIDPLLCACTRDHSNDRKDGKASGHMSTVPGKEGFVDRAKRFGARAASEGAGGGRNGRNYLEGLSHEGDGHTGPLYGLGRNVIGVGRRDNVYTSNYRTDVSLKHPCQATTGEMFMPPGITAKDLSNSQVASVYQCLMQSQYGAADKIVTRALTPVEAATSSNAIALAGMGGKAATKPFDQTMFRFFKAAIQAELDWRIQELEALKACGDVYELKRRVNAATQSFQGMAAAAEKLNPFVEHLKTKEVAAEIQNGYTFHTIALSPAKPEERIANLKQYCQRFKDSVYTKAAEEYLAKTEEKSPFSYFLAKNPSLVYINYPPEKLGK